MPSCPTIRMSKCRHRPLACVSEPSHADRQNPPPVLATLLILAVSIVLYIPYAVSSPAGTRGGSAIGLTYGIIGYGFMLYAGLLSKEGFFDKTKDDTVVLLTDHAVTDAQLRDGFELRRLAEEGKLSFVQETIDASGQIINFTVGHRAFKMAPSGGSTEHVFEGKIEGRNISGKVSTRGVQESFGGTKYEYAASFKAPILPKK
jgi:hypothetical protein